VDSSVICAALLALIMILLYVLSVSTVLINILNNDVEDLIHDLMNFADKTFNAVKSGNDNKLGMIRDKVKMKLLRLNETFTRILSNITETLLNYVDNVNVTINNSSINDLLNNITEISPDTNITNSNSID